MPSAIDRARRIADAKMHPILARAARLFDLVRAELQAGASAADAVKRARRRLAAEVLTDGEPEQP